MVSEDRVMSQRVKNGMLWAASLLVGSALSAGFAVVAHSLFWMAFLTGASVLWGLISVTLLVAVATDSVIHEVKKLKN